MKRYRMALFDFDGTLADSFPFFMATLNELARRHGFRPVTPQDVARMRRQDVRANMRLVGLPPWKLPLVAASFIRLMRERRDDLPLFDGIGDVLRQLYASGLTLALVTSNSADNARRMLGPELAALFAHCEGRSPLLGKHGRIRRVLAHGDVDPSEALYVGDQLSDLKAARRAGVDFGAVAWGYGDIDALCCAGAAQVFWEVRALGQLTACAQQQARKDNPA